MLTVELKPIIHKQQKRVAVIFPLNQQIARIVKSVEDSCWSKTHRCWHMPDNIELVKSLASRLKGEAVINGEEYKKSLKLSKEGRSSEPHYLLLPVFESFKRWMNSKGYVKILFIPTFLY